MTTVVSDLASRGAQAWEFQQQVRRVGGCERPIRLRGRVDLVDVVTGEARQVWSSEELPDGTVLVACGNRRVSRCRPCSRLYQGDAFQLVAAGLRGGKGVPDSVGSHPALFVTLTAPSFGPVHTARLDRHGNPAPASRAPTPARVNTGSRRLAGPAMTLTTRRRASRCVGGASTTRPRCCGTPMRRSCGGGPASTSTASSPSSPPPPREPSSPTSASSM